MGGNGDTLSRKDAIINNTPPVGVQFSHLSVEPTRSGAPAGHMAHENLFREPEPTSEPTPEPTPEAATPVDEPAPQRRQHDVAARPRRTTRRRTAA